MRILKENHLDEYMKGQKLRQQMVERLEAKFAMQGYPPLLMDYKALWAWAGPYNAIAELFDLWNDTEAKDLVETRNRSEYWLPPSEDFCLRFLRHNWEHDLRHAGKDPALIAAWIKGPKLPEWMQVEVERAKQFNGHVVPIVADGANRMPTIEWLLRTAGCTPPYKIEDFQAVLAWVVAPVPELEADLERKDWLQMGSQFSRKLTWNKTGDLEIPWVVAVDGVKWQVRLNRFPNRLPFTLMAEDQEVGTFLSWPKAWKRQGGEARGSRSEAAKRPAAIPLDSAAPNVDSMAWLARYEAGERLAVWNEMEALGERVQEPQYREQALAVARETVDRIHKNLIVLVKRLKEEGYKFGIAGFKADVFGKPKKIGLEELSRLQSEILVPILISAWYEKIGSVNLAGKHKVLAPRAKSMFDDDDDVPLADPLVVLPLITAIEDADAPGELTFSWSPEIKAGLGGGDGESVMLEPANADARLVGDSLERGTFLEYLRHALLEFAGFPGWKQYPGQAPTALIEKLKRDFVPF